MEILKFLFSFTKMFRYILFILALFITSCQQKTEESMANKDQMVILNLTLDRVIGSYTSWSYHLVLPPPPIPTVAFTNKIDSIEYHRLHHWWDSTQKVLDTAALFVVVYKQNDYLDAFSMTNVKAKMENENKDTTFNEVLKAFTVPNLSKDTINIGLLKPKHNFKIFSQGTAPADELMRIFSLKFSKISFDATKNKACVYTNFSCGRLCGNGDIHFFVKRNGRWTFIKTWELWVS